MMQAFYLTLHGIQACMHAAIVISLIRFDPDRALSNNSRVRAHMDLEAYATPAGNGTREPCVKEL